MNITVYHQSGFDGRNCSLLDKGVVNAETVQSIEWKSPTSSPTSMSYKLCMWKDEQCFQSGGLDEIDDGWEICYPFAGWKAWSVVPGGEICL
ncbi:hypothetical protein ASPZODRAFT_135033 [Penicilliopsis zonata CBS 506.65]|uniref:Uncharacterized protein n=1 Tax=Penicilliopsis zonata CBS 506.65 TaxID=1073090 RepID=A0A1L9SAT1_9EURO|nr:hypothetical protein ASPZODRAFT_135033 [Penicilliopsis zonata CBS 506.65]OJJ44246.1 hypothetical protein ASPZODRAFT_135033 [Penicilliopsis zonata CBS 506.65]